MKESVEKTAFMFRMCCGLFLAKRQAFGINGSEENSDGVRFLFLALGCNRVCF